MTKEKQLYRLAKQKGSCRLLKGTENTKELIELMFSPQGLEFCEKHNFPNIEDIKAFRSRESTRNGLYVNHKINAKNKPKLALIGSKTIANLEYDDNKQSYTVLVMHGAKVKIKARGYAVVFVHNISGFVEVEIVDNAKVL